jgi:hypothetical protein
VGLGKTTPSSNKNFYFAEVSIILCDVPIKMAHCKNQKKELGKHLLFNELKHEYTTILANFQKKKSY